MTWIFVICVGTAQCIQQPVTDRQECYRTLSNARLAVGATAYCVPKLEKQP